MDIINPLVDSGRLPAFSKIMREGASGKLDSTVLPITPPAWSSFMTGKNPGKHGVYGFFKSKTDSYETEFATGYSIRAKKLWEYFDKDKRIALIDIPLTFPPEEVNGYMISGMPVPSRESIFTFPPELHTELIREAGDYMIDIELRKLTSEHGIDALVHLYAYTEMRMKAIRYLINKKGPFDFTMVVFRGTDFIQHAAFKYLDRSYAEKHRDEVKKYGEIIFQFYEKMDSYLSEIMQLSGEDTTLIIMSDHGAGPLKKFFYINRWLGKEGFLALKRGVTVTRKGLDFRKKSVEGILKKTGLEFFNHFIPTFIRNIHLPYFIPYEKHPSGIVDWKKTKAYANLTWTDGLIKINLKGREPDGSVDEGDYEDVRDKLIERLLSLTDPDTGTDVFDAVYRREEIYQGPYLKEAPDIIALTKNIEYSYRVTLHGEEIFETPENPVPANHRMKGVFMIKGPDIINGVSLENTKIIDIAPVILYLTGHQIPGDMDGRLVTEAIKEETLKRNPPVTVDEETLQIKDDKEVDFNAEDRKQIEESLRNLGYMA